MRVWVVMLVAWAAAVVLDPAEGSPAGAVCQRESLAGSIVGFGDSRCSLDGRRRRESVEFVGVTEGDELSLQRALSIVHKNSEEYVAVLFYASWCPFSRVIRPRFSLLSSLYPSIAHFAIEESAVRPSILSKYGVHGFPMLFLLNSTVRVRYHGPRTLDSLVAFYNDVTGMKPLTSEWPSLEEIGTLSNYEKHDTTEPESCPFWWARSPENMLRHETYLALATAFVLLRLLYFLYPTLAICVQWAWSRHIQNMGLLSMLGRFLAYLKRVTQLSKSIKEPRKRSNLQEGARNAGVWASKSLATVSIGDASTSRSH